MAFAHLDNAVTFPEFASGERLAGLLQAGCFNDLAAKQS